MATLRFMITLVVRLRVSPFKLDKLRRGVVSQRKFISRRINVEHAMTMSVYVGLCPLLPFSFEHPYAQWLCVAH